MKNACIIYIYALYSNVYIRHHMAIQRFGHVGIQYVSKMPSTM